MATTTVTARRHLEAVRTADDRDPTDQGVRVPQPRGRAQPLTEHQRATVLAGMAAANGWTGTPDEQARQRLARRHPCPRCGVQAVSPCRRRTRRGWRPAAQVCEARAELVTAERETGTNGHGSA